MYLFHRFTMILGAMYFLYLLYISASTLNAIAEMGLMSAGMDSAIVSTVRME